MKKKSQKLQNNLKKVDLITDTLNYPIDNEVKFLVAVLLTFDFFTTSSCSGHKTGETPYIEISSEEAIAFENNIRTQELINLMDKYPGEKKYQKEYELLSKKSINSNKLEAKRLFELIREFYKNRAVDESVRLIIKALGSGLGGYRIIPEGSIFFDLKNKKERTMWLKKAQKELSDFAEFLCDKINDYENY